WLHLDCQPRICSSTCETGPRMDVAKQVIQVLDEVLALNGRSSSFTRSTHLVGSIPEFDSMAVVALITTLEERFGVAIDDDDFDGVAWLSARAPGPLWLWGARAGALLVAEAARRLPGPCNLLLWQPATTGKLVLQQFLRLKGAADLLSGRGKGVMEALRRQLA